VRLDGRLSALERSPLAWRRPVSDEELAWQRAAIERAKKLIAEMPLRKEQIGEGRTRQDDGWAT
jgi:hypothetical protein